MTILFVGLLFYMFYVHITAADTEKRVTALEDKLTAPKPVHTPMPSAYDPVTVAPVSKTKAKKSKK